MHDQYSSFMLMHSQYCLRPVSVVRGDLFLEKEQGADSEPEPSIGDAGGHFEEVVAMGQFGLGIAAHLQLANSVCGLGVLVRMILP